MTAIKEASNTTVTSSVKVGKKSKYKVKPPSNFAVVLHNDDYTPMDFVTWVLQTIFHKSESLATSIMLDVHEKGLGVAGVFHFEIAEQKATDVSVAAKQNEYPLHVTVEPIK